MLKSLPPDWDYSIEGLRSVFGCAQATICSALQDLERFGYLKRTRCTNGNLTSHYNFQLFDNSRDSSAISTSEISEREISESEISEIEDNKERMNKDGLTKKECSGGGTHVMVDDDIVSKIPMTIGHVPRLAQPTDKEFFAWQNRIVHKFMIQEDAIDACTAAYLKAVERGWLTSDGNRIVNWKKYFSQILLARDCKFWRELDLVVA